MTGPRHGVRPGRLALALALGLLAIAAAVALSCTLGPQAISIRGAEVW